MPVFVLAKGIKTVHAEREGETKNGKILSTYLLNDPLLQFEGLNSKTGNYIRNSTMVYLLKMEYW